MYYSSTKFDSFLSWVLSINGLITLGLIALGIYLLIRYFNKNKVKDDSLEQTPYYNNSSNIYNSNRVQENQESFWDDVKAPEKETQKKEPLVKGKTILQHEEEPLPPNAIEPSNYYPEEPIKENPIDEPIVNQSKESE
jgi:hypothetical protein